ncbi:MAG: purine-nucleoside phosphorylase [Planctomycetia bacterium]|nr:purine-nucleoside phosphorylase [Planctomycetia bacterium]
MALTQQVAAAVGAIQSAWPARPRVGMILGSGLGELTTEIEVQARLSYDTIPHFPRATALGHRGQLVCGKLCGTNVVAMEGRFHAYEGYSLVQVTFPVRVMSALGVELVIISNACGGMNPHFRSGDIMVIEDHINCTRDNPLAGPHDVNSGPRCFDMSRVYDPDLIERALAIARRCNFTAHRGVYIGVTGPNYETRAEYRFFRRIGGDAVGMSTVPEVIVAAQSGLRVLALSVVTNLCFPDQLQPVTGQQVIAMAAAAEPKLRAIVSGILAQEAGGWRPQAEG